MANYKINNPAVGTTYEDAIMNCVEAINNLTLKVNYLFYKDTDPQKATELMAEILGQHD